MAAETARQFAALERQAGQLMARFIAAGHEAVAPAVIQPADIFLEYVGEEIRGRTYVFTDPDGAELCLRPDLTVPTCRLHQARLEDARDIGAPAPGSPQSPARYCYNGPAFRFQPGTLATRLAREFRQAGVESFGAADREAEEARIAALVIDAMREVGLATFSLRLGDLGLLHALLEATEMPSRWRRRLSHLLWRPQRFRAELARLATDPAQTAATAPRELLAAIANAAPDDAEAIVGRHLEAKGIEPIGVRTLAEIALSLRDAAADVKARPLDAAAARTIEAYISIAAPAAEAMHRLAALLGEGKGSAGAGKGAARKSGVRAALDAFDHRLALLANAGIDVQAATFAADFGRNLEYYTGFVFDVSAPGSPGGRPVAGGGRYDDLMRAVGASEDVPAVGGAIHTERLLAVVQAAQSPTAPATTAATGRTGRGARA